MSSHYYLLDEQSFPTTDQLRDKPGVYWLIAVSRKGKAVKLPRLCRKDEKGVLYIGESSLLRTRLTTLRGMLRKNNARVSGHIAGLHYLANKTLHTTHPAERIVFRYRHCTAQKREEKRVLQGYLTKFGEFPPLNGSGMPWPKKQT